MMNVIRHTFVFELLQVLIGFFAGAGVGCLVGNRRQAHDAANASAPRSSPSVVLHPVVAGLAAGAFSWLLIQRRQSTPELLHYEALLLMLLYVSLVDLQTRTIPNEALALGLAVRLAWLAYATASGLMAVAEAAYYVASGLGVLVVLVATVLVADAVFGQDSMGGGDIKLLAVAACYVGWQQWVLLLVVACVFGLATFAIMWAAAHVRSLGTASARQLDGGEASTASTFPFGPAIALACMVTVLLGQGAEAWCLSVLTG